MTGGSRDPEQIEKSNRELRATWHSSSFHLSSFAPVSRFHLRILLLSRSSSASPPSMATSSLRLGSVLSSLKLSSSSSITRSIPANVLSVPITRRNPRIGIKACSSPSTAIAEPEGLKVCSAVLALWTENFGVFVSGFLNFFRVY